MHVRILLSCLLFVLSCELRAVEGHLPEQTLVLELEINEQVLALTPGHIPALITKASSDDIRAQCVLGVAYARGRGVPRDEALAIKWLTNAAKHGVSWVQNLLGSLYRRGGNIPPDYSEALRWFRASADQH